MVFRAPRAAPQSRVAEARRGALVGRFCHGCNQIFPLQRRLHSGDPIYGRDHVASTCPYEGWSFEAGADWWEPAIEVLPAAAAGAGASEAPAGAPTPPAGTPPAGGGTIVPPPAQPQTGSAPQQGQAAPAPVQPPPKP
jgi:hypothetical protein